MISIVDDDESVGEVTKALVRSLGYSARSTRPSSFAVTTEPVQKLCVRVRKLLPEFLSAFNAPLPRTRTDPVPVSPVK